MATFAIMADEQPLTNAPDVAEAIEHPSRLARFVAARLDPKAYLGLHVTVSLGIAALALWLFGAVLEEVLDNATVVRLDVVTLDWMAGHTSAMGLRIFTFITHLGDIPVIPAIAVVGAWVLWRQRHRLVLVCWLSAFFGGVLVNRLLKLLIPSGHTMAATIGYGMLAYVMATYWRPRRIKRRFLFLAAALIALAVGVSRIYLGMHFPTDVIGALAAGTAWVAICVTGTRIARETPAVTPEAQDDERAGGT